MDNDIYINVKDIACELVNSSSVEDTRSYWDFYHQLESVCSENEGSENNHPFQWETLADFTDDNNAALNIYKKALELSKNMGLNEYSASIGLAMADRYNGLGDKEKAYNAALEANKFAMMLDDLELRKEISEFLLNEFQG